MPRRHAGGWLTVVAMLSGADARCRGYAHAPSVCAGESVGLHLALTAAESIHPPPAGGDPRRVALELVLIGLSDDDQPAWLPSWAVMVEPAPQAPARPWEGLAWPRTAELRTRGEWPSGLYAVAEQGHDDMLCFVLRPARPRHRLLVLVDFLTPQAYCAAGGKSLYACHDGGAPARLVGLHRPDALPHPEYHLAVWLARQRIEADWCSSLDLHADPELLDAYDCLVLGGHFEYWTSAMRHHLDRWVRRGGQLVVLSGNTGFRQVRLSPDHLQMTYMRRPDMDPCVDEAELAVGCSEPPLARPINGLLGAGWLQGAFDGGHVASAYRSHFPDHWVFEGVWDGAEPYLPHAPHAPQTSAFMHYETDAAAFALRPAGHPMVTGHDGTPLHCVVLASADLRHWSRPGWATMTLCCVGRGWVFHAGSTEWLARLGEEDAALSRITANVMRHFMSADTSPRTPWQGIGAWPGVLALAAQGRGLVALDGADRLWRRDAIGASVPSELGGVAPPQCGGLYDDGCQWWALDAEAGLWRGRGEGGALPSAWTREVDPAGSRPGPLGARMTGLPQALYAVDGHGACWLRPTGAGARWRQLALAPLPGELRAVAMRDLHLLALTEDRQGARPTTCLWRSDGGFVEESGGWVCLAKWSDWRGAALTVVDAMLYLVDDQGSLHWAPSAALCGRSA